uniref:Uncharacterized protein n=1 Tax=Lepeophtheirus salmonis TaxID=72036 RepID=A0A0K2T0B3_LEPSM
MENTLQSRPPSLVSRQFIYKATWKEMYILLMDKSVSYMSKVGTALQNLYPYVSPCMVNRFQIVSNADYSKDDNNNLSIDEDEAIAVVIMMVFSYAYSTKDLRRTDIMQRYTNVMRALNRKILTKCEFERELEKIDIPINSVKVGNLNATIGKVLVGASEGSNLFVKLEDLPNYEDILNGTTPCPIAKAIRSQLAELFRDFQQTSLKLGMKIVDQLEKMEPNMSLTYKHEYTSLKEYSHSIYRDADYAGLVHRLSVAQQIRTYPRVILTANLYNSTNIFGQSKSELDSLAMYIPWYELKTESQILALYLKDKSWN